MITMRAQTKAEMGDAIARLEAEREALLDLLEAVREMAGAVPEPPEGSGLEAWRAMSVMESRALWRIAGWLERDCPGGFDPVTATRVRDRAGLFRANLSDLAPSYAKGA